MFDAHKTLTREKKSKKKKKNKREREKQKSKSNKESFFLFFGSLLSVCVFSLSALVFFCNSFDFFSLVRVFCASNTHQTPFFSHACFIIILHTFLSLSLSLSLSQSRFRRSERRSFGTFERQTERLKRVIFRESAREINDFLLEETTTTTTSSSSSSSNDNNNNERFKEFVLSIHENRSRNDRARVTPAVRRDETRERNKRDTSRRGWWRARGDSVRVVPRWWFW